MDDKDNQSQSPFRIILRDSLKLFLPLMILAGVCTSAYYLSKKTGEETTIKSLESSQVYHVSNSIRTLMNSVIGDLKIICDSPTTSSYIKEEEKYDKEMTALFIDLSTNRKIYDQIRFIDTNGLEKIRVNYKNGKPVVVPPSGLQNKFHRYYFKETAKLPKKGIYVSPLDLNIEHGKVEMPLKPMIRLGAPIFYKNKFKGIVILNYLAQQLIDILHDQRGSSLGDLYMINADGYWLHGPSAAKDWGFMFKERKIERFSNRQPNLWQAMNALKTGQVVATDGMYTFEKVDLPKDFIEIAPITDHSGFWIVSSHLPTSVWQQRINLAREVSIILFIIITLLLLITSVIVARANLYRQMAQKAILQQKSAEEWKRTFDSIDDLIAILNLDHTIKMANQKMKAEIAAKDILVECCHCAIHNSKAPIDNCPFEEVIRTGTPKRVELYEPHLQNRWFDVSLNPILDKNGNVIEVIHSMRDITNQKLNQQRLIESEERFRSIVESTGDWIWMIDEDGIIRYSNEQSYSFLGFDPAKIIKKNYLEYLDKSGEQLKNIFQELIQSHKHINQIKHKLFTRDQKELTVVTTATPLMIRDKKQMYSIITRNITEQEQLEENLRQSQKLQAVGTLAGGIAHDFNNILNGVNGYTHLSLKRLDKPENLKHYLQQIQVATSRASDLIRQILTFSRKAKVELQPTNVPIIVKEAVRLLRASIPKTIQIDLNYDSIDSVVMADPVQIHQLIMNLSVNAKHAMEDKGGTLTISLENQEMADSKDKFLKLSINDTGCGIPEEIRSCIFDPFFTTKGEGKGTGLGLSVVHGIVKTLKGTITCESEINKGTTFTILLPLCEKDEHQQKHHYVIQQGNMECVLLIDDDEYQLELMSELLIQWGFKVVAFSSTVQAWNHFEKEPFSIDLIITNNAMPVLTGMELAEKVRIIQPLLPILLIVGSIEEIDAKSLYALNIGTTIRKPYVFEEINQIIHQAFHKRNMNL